jgi:hypothetical protein
VADDAEAPLHHVDLVGLLELARHRLEIAPTRGARPVRLVQLVEDLDDRKAPLLAGTVTGAGLLALRGLLVLRAASPFRGVAEERLGAARELLLQLCDPEVKALGLLAPCLAQLGGQSLQATEEPCVLLLQQ